MWMTLRYRLRGFLGQILSWGLGLGAYGALLIPLYDMIQENQADMLGMLEGYPEEIFAFFGDLSLIATPHGYLDLYFFSFLPVILGIFVIGAGSGLLAADEESGRLDLLMSYPVSRSRLFFGRLCAYVLATLGILVMMWLGCISALGGSSIGVSWDSLALPFLTFLAHVLVYGNLALMLSMLLPSRRMASMVAGLVMVASYILSSLAGINPDLERVAQWFPYAHDQGGEAIHGLDWPPFLGMLGVAIVFALVAWWRFTRRDIRVGGEGGWRLPRWARR